jgi:hypothetical protein
MKNKYSKNKRYESDKKPEFCPNCGSKKIAQILYGLYRNYSPELKQKVKDGKIVFGGCCITDDDPSWRCIDCNANIYKNQ